ncbi:HIT family protein [Candidatus Woesearchaeota archaeon]|nr:HIT family protein [Candidatus Woesearchaeota archaeon]
MTNGQQQMSPEQVKALQEKIKKMSPEELKEFQKKQCIFCQIIGGKVASKKVYEDEVCIAILDINPANPGHILLMPKEHYAIMPMIPDEDIAHLGMVSKAISHALLKALKVAGTNIFVANGPAAGQKAQHFMIHVIPRKEGDGVGLVIPENQVSEAELSEVKKVIKERIAQMFKLTKEVVEVEKKPEVIGKKPTVEAEFEEEPKEKEEKPEVTPPASRKQEEKGGKEKTEKKPKKKIEKKTKPVKKKSKPKEEPKKEVGLDEIAGLFR